MFISILMLFHKRLHMLLVIIVCNIKLAQPLSSSPVVDTPVLSSSTYLICESYLCGNVIGLMKINDLDFNVNSLDCYFHCFKIFLKTVALQYNFCIGNKTRLVVKWSRWNILYSIIIFFCLKIIPTTFYKYFEIPL